MYSYKQFLRFASICTLSVDIYFLGFVFPGNCVKIHKEIKKIFEEEMEKSCKASTTFKACFENCAIGALFRNEKKLGAIISKTKL